MRTVNDQTKRNFALVLFQGLLLVAGSPGCGGDSAVTTTGPDSASCLVQTETTNLSGNYATWQFEYDGQGNPSTITQLNQYGTVTSTNAISSNVVTKTADSGAVVTTVYTPGILDTLPTFADVALLLDGVETREYQTFFFFYDDKDRLATVGEQTNFVMNDYEYDLTITYDDDDNVTQLRYELTTGPRDQSSIVTVNAYDDKPNPYSTLKEWKFLSNNFAWDNYDPEPILTALSANNPLDYTTSSSGSTSFRRTMTYVYNDDGFPTERQNTNISDTGERSFVQTYAYLCQ